MVAGHIHTHSYIKNAMRSFYYVFLSNRMESKLLYESNLGGASRVIVFQTIDNLVIKLVRLSGCEYGQIREHHK